MYSLKDISVVIPTYNRSAEVKETLKHLSPFLNDLREIIIVDQSKDNLTKKILEKIRSENLRYIYSAKPSITIARNLGVKRSSAKSKIICFLDDDVSIDKKYFAEILNIFNTFPEAKGAAGFETIKKKRRADNIENLIKRIFRLGFIDKDNFRVVSAYGNTSPQSLFKIIRVSWIPGVNMIYKKEVFKEQKFDENLLGYTVAEDIDFSYRLSKRYPRSIFVTPFAKFIHRVSQIERAETRRLSYINQVDHFYFNFKNMNKTLKEKIIFFWAILGISIFRVAKYTSSLEIKDKKKLEFFFFLFTILYI